jgi:hypothetical protein
MCASNLHANDCDNAGARVLSHHPRCLLAADDMPRCILDVNRQSLAASETTAKNVRSQLDVCDLEFTLVQCILRNRARNKRRESRVSGDGGTVCLPA